MNLDENQAAQVRAWIDEGLSVAAIQSQLAEKFGLRLTYMEARLLLDDLKLRPKDAPTPPPADLPGAGAGAAAPGAPAPSAGQQGEAPSAGGRVSVAVDQIARPGALVSGKVTFRDGQTAEWQLDQLGRLAVIPRQQGYKPAQADVMEFQAELEAALARFGY